MKNTVDGILRQYGTEMTLFHEGTPAQVRGFFQPFRTTSWQNIVKIASPMGEISRRQYVFIGPADTQVQEDDVLVVGTRYYLFRRVEPYYYGDIVTYLWGLCVEKGVNEPWGTES